MKRVSILALLGLLAIGCGSNSSVAPTSSATVDGKQGAYGEPATIDNNKVGTTTIAHEPPKDGIPAGGIMLQPADPNDPKFKPDPKLGGGGG